MTFRTLIRRNLRFHWRAHLGVVLGAAVGSAALIGALVVGDSVRESLRERALERLGEIHLALTSHDRFFKDDLGKSLHESFEGWWWLWETNSSTIASFHTAPAIALTVGGTAVHQDSGTRASHVTITGFLKPGDGTSNNASLPQGATRAFQRLRYTSQIGKLKSGDLLINEALTTQLHAKTGDEIVLRFDAPIGLSLDSPVSSRAGKNAALTLRVVGILDAKHWGNLQLKSGGSPIFNAFVDLDQLQAALNLEGRANNLFYGVAFFGRPARLPGAVDRLPNFILRLLPSSLFAKIVEVPDAALASRIDEKLSAALRLEDAETSLKATTDLPDLSLSTRRVFLDPPVVRAALAASPNAQPILTYLANLLRAGTNATPYSMVTAAGAPWTPADFRDNEIVVSQWLAEDLRVRPGDEIAMSYFLPESGAKLTEATNMFRVRSIVPMDLPWADRTLMPEFPGIEKAESTRDWDAGFPLVHKIRPKDEDYWKQYRGTPKAFITLAAGQKMWANRFGELTAIRFPIPTNSATTNSVEAYRAALEKKILATLKPEELGLRFEPVREQALKAAEQSQDFGQLFLGFSIFLIVAALLLMALLFQFGLEQRMAEVGTLLALGFKPKQVRRLLLGEGVALAFVGGVLGTVGGLAYARAMLHGLATVWRDAVGASALSFHFTAQTLVIGLFASVVVGVATIWLTLRKFVRRPARELLVGEVQSPKSKDQRRAWLAGILALTLAIGLVMWTILNGDTANAGAFFAAGALLLVAGLGFVSAWLGRLAGREGSPRSPSADAARSETATDPLGGRIPKQRELTLSSLGLRGCARRRKRSLATVALLASGCFLILAIGVFRLDANRDATERSSGTGGFALIGETTMPVVQDLNSKSGRDFFALNASDLEGVNFVPFRVHEGDEASCLNLNRAQRPRLLGVKPEMLEGRFTFRKGAGWGLLRSSRREEAPFKSEVRSPKSEMNQSLLASVATNGIEVPAIGDANSIQWALGKKVGDTLDYVDERGQPFKVRIAGAVANSILQGSLIIGEAEFVKRFPSESGYRMFLIDAPTNRVAEVSATLSRAMQDVGLELTPTAQRLAQFNAVQNTYLGTFQILGGLGLLLGSVGLGVVVLRNVLERRGELALLLAVGFRAQVLQRLVLAEHGALLGLGLAIGIVAAAVAVLPALLAPGAQLPFASLGLTLGAVLANGALWTWLATRFALRGNLLDALRNE